MKRLKARYLDILNENENISHASGKCMLQDVDQIVAKHMPAGNDYKSVALALHNVINSLQTLLNDGINYNTFVILRAYALKQVKNTKIIAKKI